MAFLSYRVGRKTHSSKQFPPPGSEFPFSMKIKRGRKALHQAYAAYFVSAILTTHGIAVLVYGIYSASLLKEMANII
jgi:hypothetical protein